MSVRGKQKEGFFDRCEAMTLLFGGFGEQLSFEAWKRLHKRVVYLTFRSSHRGSIVSFAASPEVCYLVLSLDP